jgi:hypothetical protein
MVPGNIIAEFDTHIKKARYSSLDIQDIQGKINMKDSIITVRELGLTSNAAEITLNAFYRPVNPNHIYANFDYHMVNIHIGELLKVVTDIDSLMPMLRSFDGKVDFHFAAETYLDSFYNMKYPTLRAASSIRGDSLLIQDGEVFSQIAKTLRFKNKKQQNLVDSLSVEFVVYKRQIEVDPFLISMDRYKVAIAGKHNLDMSFNYHVSLLSSPIPGSYGADISGNIDKLKIRLVKPRYKKMFVPTKHGVVESSQMEIRQKIRQSLVSK